MGGARLLGVYVDTADAEPLLLGPRVAIKILIIIRCHSEILYGLLGDYQRAQAVIVLLVPGHAGVSLLSRVEKGIVVLGCGLLLIHDVDACFIVIEQRLLSHVNHDAHLGLGADLLGQHLWQLSRLLLLFARGVDRALERGLVCLVGVVCGTAIMLIPRFRRWHERAAADRQLGALELLLQRAYPLRVEAPQVRAVALAVADDGQAVRRGLSRGGADYLGCS